MSNKLNAITLNNFVDTGISLLILRVAAAGLLFYNHGLDKLMNVIAGNFPAHFDPIGLGSVLSYTLAAFAEGICTLFLVGGFYTRLAALILMINMFVASFIAHAGAPFGRMELPLLYLVLVFVIFLLGPGKYSVDSGFNK